MPLNHQVSSQLEAAIAAGRLPKGSYLSGEIELAARWASPGPTARRAIEEPVAADDQLAALLEVAVGAPLVHLVTVQIVMSDDHRHCFDLGRHIYDAALYTNNTRDVEP